jgi:hypothetical protein
VRHSFYGGTRGDVKAQIDKAVQKFRDGTFAAANRQDVKQFLHDWLESAKPRLRDKTCRSSRRNCA